VQEKERIMKLSASTGDFRHISDDPAVRVACYEGTGFRYLNLSRYKDALPGLPLCSSDEKTAMKMFRDVSDTALRLRLNFIMGHAPDGEKLKDNEERNHYLLVLKRCIRGFSFLGIRNMVLHAAMDDSFDQKTLHEKNRAFLSLILPTAEKYGMHILVENGFYKNGLLLTGEQIMEYIRAMDHPLVKACWDTGHAGLSGADQYISIKAMKDCLYGLHVADNCGYFDRHTAPFCGNINFDPVMQALVETGYSGYFNFECDYMLMPKRRFPWTHLDKPVETLCVPPLHLTQKAVALTYEIGKYMLSQYGLWED
jgi:sugar phosphate isomerase/epimerase